MKTLTLADLFIKSQPVVIRLGDGEFTAWVRVLSTTERELCQAIARNASRRYRKILEDRKTEQWEMFVRDELDVYNEQQLRDLWISSRLTEKALEIHQRSLEDRDKTFIPEPEGNVTLAQTERYENEVEEVEEQRESGVLSAIQAAREELEKEAAALSLEALRADAEPSLVDQLCAQVWQREYAVSMIAHGTFKDEALKKPMFKTSDEVKNLVPAVLETLTNAHYALLLEPEALKTSGGA